MNLPTIKGKARWAVLSATIALLCAAGQILLSPAIAAAAEPLRVASVNDWITSAAPNLLTIGVIGLTAYCAVLVTQRIFALLARRRLVVPGFPASWAKPTALLLQVLMIAVALVVVYPYLPWVDSVAFQGIAVLLGGLLLLGAASLMGDLVGGMALLYTRAFQIGDRVKIADVTGDVIEQTVLVTRLRTPKNRVVALPNRLVVASQVEHLTDDRWIDATQPPILSVTLNIAYKFPWRKVQAALLQAAQRTDDVLETPEPFVLHKALTSTSVQYELNIYTDRPRQLDMLRSRLYQNILDACNEAGIELIAPEYAAMRDGKDPAMPEDYFAIRDLKPGARAGFSRQWFGALTAANTDDHSALDQSEAFESELDDEDADLQDDCEAADYAALVDDDAEIGDELEAVDDLAAAADNFADETAADAADNVSDGETAVKLSLVS